LPSGNHFRVVIRGAVTLLSLSALLSAQNPAPASAPDSSSAAVESDSIATFHATSRLVLVDVVATDKTGRFVPGLTPDDFTVLEDGKPQRISGFSAHVADTTARSRPALQLPPHQYTNFTTLPPDRAVNIILLDMLDMPRLDQSYAWQQMLKFLAAMPAEQTVALFALNSRLTMIQGFTGSSDSLVAAAKRLLLDNSTSHLRTEKDERQTWEIPDSPLGSPSLPGDPAALLNDALSQEQEYQGEVRTLMVLQSLQALARSVSGYSGRKNLLWLSSEFPFRFDPEFNREGQSHQDRDHHSQILETASLMAASQIAVYPIDVTGLTPDTPYTTARVLTRWDRQDAMADIARQTGGLAFYGSNDLKSAMLRSIQEGTNYYTVAYAPANPDWNGKYRKIEIKVKRPHVELRHRSGYYAVAQPEFKGDQAAKMLASAMLPTVPESTMLLLRVQVLPPDQDHKAVRIDYAVEAQDIAFTDVSGKRKHAAVDFMAAAWDKHNQDVGHATDLMETSIRPEQFEQVMKTGLPMHQELELKPGSYLLRLGVIDRGSQKIGTVDVPLTIPASEISKK
jgi:VWFA-related protein